MLICNPKIELDVLQVKDKSQEMLSKSNNKLAYVYKDIYQFGHDLIMQDISHRRLVQITS